MRITSKESIKQPNKKVSEKDDSHTPSSRAVVGPQEKAQPSKKRSRQVETFRRYRRRPVRQSRSINPNDKWKHLGLHPRETMNILTNGMSIKNIKKRERNAKRRKQKAYADQESCKLSKRRKRKRETAVQAKSSCMPRKRRVPKAAQMTESRNRVTRRQESSRPRKSKNNNLEESKTKNRLPKGRNAPSVVIGCSKNIRKIQTKQFRKKKRLPKATNVLWFPSKNIRTSRCQHPW